MCIIFFSEDGKIPQRSALKTAHENNPDGVGLMYHDGKKVAAIRGLMSFDDTWNLLKLMKGRPYAMHFRYRTRGPVGAKTCHPFRIREAKNGFNTWMMHNGTIGDITIPSGMSDTQAFARNLEGIINDHGSKILIDPKVINNMANKIKAFNKLVFMNDNGDVRIVNAKSGFTKDGIWYSNDYSFIEGYRKKASQTEFKRSFITAPTPVSTLEVKVKEQRKSTISDMVIPGFEDDMNDDFLDSDFPDMNINEDVITEEESSRWLEEAKRQGYVCKRPISSASSNQIR